MVFLVISAIIASIVTLFLITSRILLKYPHLIHSIDRPRRLKPSLLKASKAAHRGSRAEGLPENTLSAFTDALICGADIIEFDVWLSRDNEVIVFHDENFERMTSETCTHRVTDTDYQSFPLLVPPKEQSGRIKLEGGHDAASHSHYKIPLLADVLSVLPPDKVSLIIEFKQDSDLLIAKVQELLEKHGHIQNVIWFSLIDKINNKLRAANSSRPNISSVIGLLKVLALYYFGIIPFMTIPYDVIGVTIEEVSNQLFSATTTKYITQFFLLFFN